ncbi:short-chain dehydrogenase/reductase SDR [Vibrio variabilis]|uniref:Short-chain dehydrogenase/reductase SDR n=1 Tax=Vibrio variabilis TaxID=990271 RepID=A0ABQ0J8Y2_9VIBR|nr:short-chain dehydrogenase/reductase SDR [Vibrio variabilis]
MDVLINNAGGLGGRKGLESIDDALFDHVMNLNARSALMVTKYAILTYANQQRNLVKLQV